MGGGVGRVGEGDNQKSVDCPGSLWHSKPMRASDPLLGRNSAFRQVGTLAYTPEWVQPRQTKLCRSPVLQSEVTRPFEHWPGLASGVVSLLYWWLDAQHPQVLISREITQLLPRGSHLEYPGHRLTVPTCAQVVGCSFSVLWLWGFIAINFGCQGNHTAV